MTKLERLLPVLRVLRTLVPLAVGLVALVLVIAWVSGFFLEKIPAGAAEAQVRKLAPGTPTDTVHELTKTYYEEAVGTLKAASRTEISSRVLAPIEKIHVRAGQAVRSGEVLIELDSRQLITQRSQAQANLTAAEAAFENAQGDYQRKEKAYASRAIPKQQLDDAFRNLEVSRANLTHARQALAETEVLLSYATIKAPKAGVVVDRLADAGDTAQPGTPLLVLYDPDSLRLEVPVMEDLAGRLHVGDRLTVRIDSLPPEDREVEAVVDEIVPQAEAASRSVIVKSKVPRRPGMYEGMFGRLLVPAGKRRHLCLNTAAIQRIGQLEFVDVVGQDEVLERRFIKTGRIGFPGRVEVLSGLEAGERVVLYETPESEQPAPAQGSPDQPEPDLGVHEQGEPSAATAPDPAADSTGSSPPVPPAVPRPAAVSSPGA